MIKRRINSLKEEVYRILKQSTSEKLSTRFFDGVNWSELNYENLISNVRIISNFIEELTGGTKQCIAFCVPPFLGLQPLIFSAILTSNPFFFVDPSTIGSKHDKIALRKLKIRWLLTNGELTNPHLSFNKSVGISCAELKAYCNLDVSENVALDVSQMFLYGFTTSGTTGVPKVVRVPEQSILPNIEDFSSIVGIDAGDSVLLNSPLTFDPSMVEFFLAIINSALLIVAGPNVRIKPSLIMETIEKGKVSFYQTTPSLFNAWPVKLKNRLFNSSSSIKTVILGGEPFPSIDEVEKWQISENTRIYNTYGITEVSCWATLNLVWPNDDLTKFANNGIDIGKPLGDTLLKTEPIEEDQLHHLYVGSNKRICCVEDEHFQELKSIKPIFRPTGDLFRVVDGKYYFYCRNDSIVKRLGKKVDLRFIETEARNFGLEIGVVAKKMFRNDYCRLIMFVVGLNNSSQLTNRLSALKDALPDDHWVDDVEFISALPLSTHGKLDKKKLVELYDETLKNRQARVNFKELWNLATSGFRTRFTSIEKGGFLTSGGNSFSAVLLINSLEDEGFVVHPDLLLKLLGNAPYEQCVELVVTNAIELPSNGPTEEVVNVDFKNQKEHDCQLQTKESTVFKVLKGRVWNELPPKIDYTKWNDKKLTFGLSWKINLLKCVDASTLGVVFNDDRSKDFVIVGSHSGRIVVACMETGDIVARTELPDRIEASACLSGDSTSFYVGCYDGQLYKINIQDGGSIQWTFTTGDIIKSSCVLHNGKVLFPSYDKYIYAVSEEGDLKWRRKVGPSNIPVLPIESCVVVGTLTGIVIRLRANDGSIIQRVTIGPPLFSEMRLVSRPDNSDTILICPVNGNIQWRDVDSFTEIASLKVPGTAFAAPVIINSSQILVASGYMLHSIQPPDVVLWSCTFKSRIVSTPFNIASTNRVISTTIDGELSIVDLTTGEVLSSYQLPGEVFSSPIVVGSTLFVGCRDNHLYCLQLV